MMAFANSYVACITANNANLREFNKDNLRHVHLPYGTEYGILLKNKSPQRCAVRVSIDGTDVLCAKQIILDANQSMTLERFVDSLSGGQRFKFVSKETAASNGTLQDPDSPLNGLVRVEFYREAPPIIVNGLSRTGWYVDFSSSQKVTTNCTMDWLMEPQSATYCCTNSAPSGVTEQGSHSSQSFSMTTTFTPESEFPTEVITFRLCAPQTEEPMSCSATLNICPSCNDRGFVPKRCDTCNNTGKVWILYAPEVYPVMLIKKSK